MTIQPTEDSLTHLKPPDMFEDISQMTEWLILMESKLQPNPLEVGNTAQVKSALDEVEVFAMILNQIRIELYCYYTHSYLHSYYWETLV